LWGAIGSTLADRESARPAGSWCRGWAPMPKLLGLHALPPAEATANGAVSWDIAGSEKDLKKKSPSAGQGFRARGR
jgi:hypothetical protein